MNTIQTWRQGKFIDSRQYDHWTLEDKEMADATESHLVRPSPLGNSICYCLNPKDAAWIAERLNLVSKLEVAVHDNFLAYEDMLGQRRQAEAEALIKAGENSELLELLVECKQALLQANRNGYTQGFETLYKINGTLTENGLLL
ncbi:hypothetical protein [Methylotenera sp.]|uniref:hypothetical protein n=1 Tax=Methylotenera sp. TaxID=2051956 RepID=UPI0024890545|nr:hypothetical protein [Methylotenera sp.]MDI1362535.1 hypothetical protein [Methylotenera sp.]